ncbi:TrpB-like pyridoxal phosphate-dependent enzyme [Cellulomonas fimi]|uniref:tryptophan synthase n=1 Tax=Cellulomonas fimi (strain ATCC 484 / DSM 20113 / JCM 1341 / CCUG 24087 / LMG 16345 / NBRC 15513 / NCIMB 8980 / NCTC 7547 / NRS-133) TaxID=590998 RepID=F4H7V6_CELFA|nr:TrpB-like pyridoxal phosphate-dependent enzyme [Cellulomonas fimi]AEE45790.1 pyridoxal-phosphate dependent TrpB-like enzyme [Cellulomonas fimi ATCC 484]NNH08550.1 TrpB-like pyridoxal phosphate-dependent enzyme [Cellulomonas fimi]VEH30605.1 Tryptophan synthase beta chain [Cellulomonas fimi]
MTTTPDDVRPAPRTEPLGVTVPSTVPTHWYNLAADLPEPCPPALHPGTREPLTPDDLAPLFPMALIAQEVSTERWVEIPQTVRELYALWRPSPLVRAVRLERALGTPARIYYKYEGVSPVGSHKPNTAVAQAYYNAVEGITKLTTETGAGQWGASLSMACALLGLRCEVWQVRASYDSKPYRRMQMETYGGVCHSSPSELTAAGRAILASDPETTGSLGMAISEAVEAAATDPAAHYALGSVLNHVLLHQSVIGQEALAQLDEIGEGADVVFGCAGGGSNLGGLAFPFLGRNLREGTTTRVVACEPAACPSMTQGEYRYDFGDVAGLTPLLKMHTLGKDFVPPPIHAGGLRYHGMAPMVSHAYELGLMSAIAVEQGDAFAAGIEFARAEGIIPAPESTHAVAGAIAHARAATEPETIVIGLSGNGILDLPAYHQYL